MGLGFVEFLLLSELLSMQISESLFKKLILGLVFHEYIKCCYDCSQIPYLLYYSLILLYFLFRLILYMVRLPYIWDSFIKLVSNAFDTLRINSIAQMYHSYLPRNILNCNWNAIYKSANFCNSYMNFLFCCPQWRERTKLGLRSEAY
jgi:hypothetical protein